MQSTAEKGPYWCFSVRGVIALHAMRRSALASAIALAGTISLFAQFPGMAPAGPTGPWMDRTLSPDQRASLLVQKLTLDEKIGLVHGSGWDVLFRPLTQLPPGYDGGAGFIPGIPKYGIPDLQISDAAVGVGRGSVFGRYATPLPSALSEACSWDVDIAREYGSRIGRELYDFGFNMSLGGGVDITREPRNGRNFEYLGEDPILAGTLVGAEMKAEQAEGVIGDIKHYAMNDQENGRNYVNIVAGKRAMRETDLLAFEIGVRESGAGAVMCSYNLVNGDYACQNDYLLNQVLKNDFGFKGFVISDWGATHSTVQAALAGLDMEQPAANFFGDPLKAAVQSGQVPESRLDDMVHRILRAEFAVGLFDKPHARQVPDPAAGYRVAQQIAERGSVLLKNEHNILPLESRRVKSIAIIGSHADAGVLSGGGSAQVDPPGGNAVAPPASASRSIFGRPVWDRSSPLAAIRQKSQAKVDYNDGSDPASAAAFAKTTDLAIVFVHQWAAENSDLPNLSLPNDQDALVDSVSKANPNTIVVIESGGAVRMPWVSQVRGILEVWFPGIRGGEAIANLLFGDVNPSGKLAITFPKSEADLPRPELAQQPPARGPSDMVAMFGGLPIKANGRHFDVTYQEGVEVGYRWYEAHHIRPLFPFGFGLSYTTYSYSGLKVTPGERPTVSFSVKNTGKRAGHEVAQVYALLPDAAGEPFQRLIGWQTIELHPGEQKSVSLPIDPQYLSIFDVNQDAWTLVPGAYKIAVGPSSTELPLNAGLNIGQ